ncbi:chorismate mutase [Candidatus Gracilibacteria bacterium]|nr:chorismate mutase [Candidatus Gracilibacteria bacterium]
MNLDELLTSFRNQIDTIDEEIIYLLSRRFELVKQIGKIKKDLGEEALQPKRWEEVIENLYSEADDKGVSREIVKAIWNSIHDEALRIEK